CAALPNRIHFVGHSLGGLVIRAYLQENPVETLGRVVLIGTPNQGSDFVDRYQDRWWLKMLGPTTQALGTGPDSLVKSLQVPDYPVGVIAGVQESANDAYLPGDDDGLVSVAATKLEGMKDFRLVEVGHSAMRYDDTVAQLTVAFLRNGAFPVESQ
ncbi:MAG: alpha/beta fold hydrolase, partial [Pseudomonadota bacterium]|nr:alpha/beta fold hydrolase [Pseudomonadota bacterium]